MTEGKKRGREEQDIDGATEFEAAFGIVREYLSQNESSVAHAEMFNNFVLERGFVRESDSDYESEDGSDEEGDEGEDSDDIFGEGVGDAAGIVHGDQTMMTLHPPIAYAESCCPPCDIGIFTSHRDHVCDCTTRHGFDECCSLNNFADISHPDLDWANERQTAMSTAENPLREPNNIRRKRLYRLVFAALDFGGLEPGERRRLPNCAVAFIRSAYPSRNGQYMGYKEA